MLPDSVLATGNGDLDILELMVQLVPHGVASHLS